MVHSIYQEHGLSPFVRDRHGAAELESYMVLDVCNLVCTRLKKASWGEEECRLSEIKGGAEQLGYCAE